MPLSHTKRHLILLKTLKRNNVVIFKYYFKKYIGQQFPTKLGNSRESLNIPRILTKRHLTLLKTLKRNNVVIFKYYFKKYIGQYVGNLQCNIIGKNIVSIAKYIKIYQIYQSIHKKKWENLSEQIDKIVS